MFDPDLKDLWTPAGLLLGFQVTLFKWRLEREAEVGDKGDIPWLTPSDYVSLIGMLAFVFGVVLLPVSGVVSTTVARWAFGLGALLFVGQALGLAGHYQLFNRTQKRQFVWFSKQEKVVVALTGIIGIVYTVLTFCLNITAQNKLMKYAATATSMALAIAALIVGLRAAWYWWKAGKIEIDPGWNSGMPGDTRPPQPADLEGIGTIDGWVNATMQTVTQGSALNKKAAKLTAYSVVLAGLSSVTGALTNFL